MLDKYFGFLKIHDEDSVIESFLEHARIDEEEIAILNEMVEALCNDELEDIQSLYLKIRTISVDSEKMFESIADQIVNADFDHQKQYDLLRIYQRIEGVSGLIIASAKRMLILQKIGGKLPEECKPVFRNFMRGLTTIQELFKQALEQYLNDKKDVFKIISKIEETEHHLDHDRSETLEILYSLGNQGKIKLGDLRAVENTIDHLEDLSDKIEETSKSLEWLLFY